MAEQKFEVQMARLDEIVRKMESGEGDLDEMLALYEEGVKLSKSCNKMLDEAQQKVTLLSKGENGIEEVFFEGEQA